MQLDNTTITIRERNMFEILDLSLRIIVTHYRPLLSTWLIGIAPFAALNLWVLGGMGEIIVYEDTLTAYIFWSLIWTGLIAPLATAPLTLVLGQILFQTKISYRRLVRDFRESIPQLLLLQGLLRLICFFPAFVPYFAWPYLTEVILLERNPLSARKQTESLSTWQRTKVLHRAAGGELFARWIGVSAAAGMVFASLAGSMIVVVRQFEPLDDPLSPTITLGLATIAAYMAVGFTAVVRFLAYIDLRIRREGWEVELTMRAEGMRMRHEWHYA